MAGQARYDDGSALIRGNNFLIVGVSALFASMSISTPALTAEGGSGFYLLGSRSIDAGIVPPPGKYLQFGVYGYAGNASSNIPQGGRLDVDLNGDALMGLITSLWAFQGDTVFGGRPYIVTTLPVGWKQATVGAQLTAPNGNILSDSKETDSFLVGDPVIGAGLGWDSGAWHSSVNVLLNLPVGDYQSKRSTNISFNRWGADITAGLTWLGTSDWQIDSALGITFNGNNSATDYRTGNEMHFEGGIRKKIGAWKIGLVGYHYEQITGDRGEGAVLGPFKGRVSAIGPTASWSGIWGGRPIAIDMRWYHELSAKNRVKGDAVFLNLTVPVIFNGG